VTTCEFIITIIVSVVFSDVAAVITTLIYQNHKAKKARLTVLRALANEVERIRKVVEHNGQLKVMDTVQPVTRMPMVAFETAFVSGEPGLDVSDGLLQAVTDYLACAASINSLVETYAAFASSSTGLAPRQVGVEGSSYCGYTIQQIVEASTQKLPGILDALHAHLKEEMTL
jgi:hypothetical protein